MKKYKDNSDEYYYTKYSSRGVLFKKGFLFPNTAWSLEDDKIYHRNGVKVKVKCGGCGIVFFRPLSSLTHKNPPKSCKSCKKNYSVIKASDDWIGPKGIPAAYFNRTKEGARQRQLRFDITNEQVYNLYISQSKNCALSGQPIFFSDGTTYTTTNASLDRIDNNNGYTIDNVQWIHKDINKMKNSFSQEYFISVCHSIASSSNITNNIFEALGFKSENKL